MSVFRTLAKSIALALITVVGMLAYGEVLLAASVEAKADGVNVYAEASKTSSVLATLKKGQELTAADRKGMYWQVKVDGKNGFVSVLQVNHKAEGSSSLAKAIRSATHSDRDAEENASSGRARSAVMGVRGFGDADLAMASNAKPDLRSVYGMEDMVIPKRKIEALGKAVAAEVEKRARREGMTP